MDTKKYTLDEVKEFVNGYTEIETVNTMRGQKATIQERNIADRRIAVCFTILIEHIQTLEREVAELKEKQNAG